MLNLKAIIFSWFMNAPFIWPLGNSWVTHTRVHVQCKWSVTMISKYTTGSWNETLATYVSPPHIPKIMFIMPQLWVHAQINYKTFYNSILLHFPFFRGLFFLTVIHIQSQHHWSLIIPPEFLNDCKHECIHTTSKRTNQR
jgi:hypothetical protein